MPHDLQDVQRPIPERNPDAEPRETNDSLNPLASKRVAIGLGLAFGVVVALLIVVGDLGLRRMDHINSNLQDMVGSQWNKLRMAREAMTYSNRNSRITMQVFLLKDRKQIDSILAARSENTKNISSLLAQLQSLCKSDEEQRLLLAVNQTRSDYVKSYQRALHTLVDERNRDVAADIMVRETSPALVKYQAAWDEFASREGTQLELEGQRSNAGYAAARQQALLIIAIAVFAFGILALFVIRRILQEFTNRMLADKEALLAAHQEAEVFINAVPSILVGLDHNERITRWNSTAAKVFGIAGTEAAGKYFSDCGIKWMRPGMQQEIKSWFSGPSRRCDQIPFELEGKTRLLGLTIKPVVEAGEISTKILVIGSDTTERNVLEDQLRQAQKLESVGQLAAGIAHEINTPTQYIGDNVRFLQDAFSDLKKLLAHYERLSVAGEGSSLPSETVLEIADAVKRADPAYLLEEIPKAIEQTLEGVGRVSTLVSAMKEFSHPGTKEKVPVDLNHAIESTITVARNEWKYVADLETDFDRTLPLILCQPGEFNQVILNLIVNAAHAIGDVIAKGGSSKGMIKVQTRNCPQFAEIRIEDTGSGIPEHVRPRIFDPFFTTKEIGKGTGQGLAIARSVVVDKHEGTIHFETEHGKGTTFIIRIPKDEGAVAAKAASV